MYFQGSLEFNCFTNRHHDILSTLFLLMLVSEIWCLVESTAHRWNWSVFWFESTTNGSRNIANWPLWSSNKINHSVIRFLEFIIPDSLNVFWWFCSKWQLTQKGSIYSLTHLPSEVRIPDCPGLCQFFGHF